MARKEVSKVTLVDRVLEVFLTVTLIVGGYQPYFWAQRQTFWPAKQLETPLDSWIEFDCRWVWVYSGLYYPMIVLVAMAQPDWQSYAYTVGGFLFLLACQMYFFLFHPVEIPEHFRDNTDVEWSRVWRPRSMDFLDMVWSFDKMRNSMPSMHVSVATMVDLCISQRWPDFAYVGWIFPVLIGTSAIKTKQHYVVDVVPGAAMGAAAFYAWRWLTS